MTKAERIRHLKASYRHESKALAACKDDQFATAKEQKLQVSGVLSGIKAQLRKLGCEI